MQDEYEWAFTEQKHPLCYWRRCRWFDFDPFWVHQVSLGEAKRPKRIESLGSRRSHTCAQGVGKGVAYPPETSDTRLCRGCEGVI